MKPKSIKFAAMTIHEANMRLLFELYHLYDNREAANIADLVMENITGWKRIDRVINKEVTFSPVMIEKFNRYMHELATHKPVQYVLEEAWFAGMKLFVNDNVLIPRPETEELADLVVKEKKKSVTTGKKYSFLDIGTGSGCIAIAIKKAFADSNVYALDVSAAALQVAERNAASHAVEINYLQGDILDEEQWINFPDVDFIISNPPYIPEKELNGMSSNVTEHEPHLALFVPDNDPLIFYKAISRFAVKKLSAGGKIFAEIHENFADEVAEIFGLFTTVIRKDMQGKNRFVVAFSADPGHSQG